MDRDFQDNSKTASKRGQRAVVAKGPEIRAPAAVKEI